MPCTQNVSDLIAAIVPAAASVIAIFISASITRKSERENNRRQFLSSAYSDLLMRYTQWLDTKDSSNKASLLAAIARARLLAEPETELALKNFEKAVIHDSKVEEIGKTLGPLRRAMRDELQHPKKKNSKKRKQKDTSDN